MTEKDVHDTINEARELAEAEAWLDQLDPETTPAEDPVDLRRVSDAADAIEAAQGELVAAVAAARENGRS